MSIWRQLTRGLRVLLQRDAADRDLDAELEQYLDEASVALVAEGASPEDARRALRLQTGGALLVRERVRDEGWERVVGATLADVRYAVRRLRHDAGFTAVAVVTLALGIGTTTAMFSAVNPILFEPLPYPRADRLVSIADRGGDGAPVDVTFGTYREIAARTRAFDAVAVTKPWQPTLSGATPERLDGQRVSAAYLRVFGVAPALGRDFDEADDRPDAPQVVIISSRLWLRRFGGDAATIGRVVTLDGDPFTVIGVMPASFQIVQLPTADAWAPLRYDPALPPDGREWGHHLRMVARLGGSVRLAAARDAVDAIARRPVPEFRRMPWASMRQGLALSPLQDDVVRGVRPALVALTGAVLLVLAAACVNVMNLLLARGGQRRGELAMRTALGASRARIVRQLVTESLVLAIAGGAAGVLVADAGVHALVALAPARLPRVDAVRLDTAALAFAMVISAIVGVLVGVAPAWHAARGDTRGDVQHAARAVARRRAATGALVVAEVGLAVVLTVVAGLLVRSMQRLFAVDPGFSPAHVLTLQVRATTVGGAVATRQFFDRALNAVRRLPQVEAAGWTSQLPLTGDYDKYGVRVESSGAVDTARDQSALRYAVTPGYFEAMGLHLRRGRWLDVRDRAGASVAVLVSDSFVRHRLAGRDAIGQRVHVGGRLDLPWYTVVGVVADVKQTSLAIDEADAVYINVEQWSAPEPVLSLAVKISGDPAALAPAVRTAIWAVDPDQAIVRTATLEALVAASTAERRFALTIFECFALAALALAATGIYGVLSGSVTERLREIGVRAALGASRREILGLVFRQGMVLAGVGVAAGALAAVGAGRGVATLLFGVSPLDAPTYATAVVLLAAVAALACWAPAWRASRVDPAIMLRAE